MFFDYWRQHRLRIKVARIFNTYGPRMHPHDGRVVSNFIIQALLGRDITIYGDGSQTRSFCYVDDLIDGLVRLMGSSDEVVGPINIGNPIEFSMLQLANVVCELTGSRSRIVHRPLPQDDPRQRQPDISKAQEILGWKPATPLKEGLGKTIAYFEALLREPGIVEVVGNGGPVKPLNVQNIKCGQRVREFSALFLGSNKIGTPKPKRTQKRRTSTCNTGHCETGATSAGAELSTEMFKAVCELDLARRKSG